ncbi:hypothetical protein A2154_02320 [Candidatus Gottesmanbacteria bacterium RBG_16_43_7]|uniref:THIF-type NAD/FAD binding fold domain-containing protein n=1 Tax=Candidatus Gottesmanbacteria bacterium RBG_16_43_7 TaxID=1798373 RepID=A0A1F5Z836_9BACT|nr:MAG: hypothetical protein A2154_02320 [Candidatus Gottesmanbacteria bacterium RBG_16_43_7]
MANRDTRLIKTIGSQGLRRLRQATVAVVGEGSLGSQVTLLLAMSGVGNFILVDPDKLEEHNISRHACDLRDAGRNKVDAVSDLIRSRNPDVSVSALALDALTNSEVLALADLVLVAGLGSEIVTRQLAMILRQMRKPALFGGVYEKGVAGDIFYVDPNSDGPCFACIASRISEMRPARDVAVNYGIMPDELKAQPGLGAQVGFIASPMAQWTLRILIQDKRILCQVPGNCLVLANESYPYRTDDDGKPVFMRPNTTRWYDHARLEGCNVCSPLDGQQDLTLDDVLEI